MMSPKESMTLWAAIGIAGKNGEVIGLVKKERFHLHALDLETLAKEIGEEVEAVANIDKCTCFTGQILNATKTKRDTQ